MSILGTYNGATVFSAPCDSIVGVTAPSSIEWNPREFVSKNESPFTGQTQTYDWQVSMWEGMVSFPPMSRLSADAWSSFILALRGPIHCFMLGDPKARLPKGTAKGTPLVNGANQTGYTLYTDGWDANQPNLLVVGDFIQIGWRLYKVTQTVASDSTGHGILSIWPNLRDLPADNTPVVVTNCKGIFRLAQSTNNKWSTNVGNYGMTGLQIREVL